MKYSDYLHAEAVENFRAKLSELAGLYILAQQISEMLGVGTKDMDTNNIQSNSFTDPHAFRKAVEAARETSDKNRASTRICKSIASTVVGDLTILESAPSGNPLVEFSVDKDQLAAFLYNYDSRDSKAAKLVVYVFHKLNDLDLDLL